MLGWRGVTRRGGPVVQCGESCEHARRRRMFPHAGRYDRHLCETLWAVRVPSRKYCAEMMPPLIGFSCAMQVGGPGGSKLTYTEQRSHFALWAIIKSPLILGADLRYITCAISLITYANIESIPFHLPQRSQRLNTYERRSRRKFLLRLAGTGSLPYTYWTCVSCPLLPCSPTSCMALAFCAARMLREQHVLMSG